MSAIDNGHDTNCTYRKCAHPESPSPCPFVQDALGPMVPKTQDHDSRHEHKYVIPVEWEYYEFLNDRNALASPSRKRVLKLRCECGAETART